MKRLMLLGATGSIGTQCLNVVKHHADEFTIVGLSAGRNIKELVNILDTWDTIQYVSVANECDYLTLKEQYVNIQFYYGDEGLSSLASISEYDMLVNAVVGFRGLLPLLKAIEAEKEIALANKESLVTGGALVKEALKKHPVKILPIDSEHAAIFQCLQGNQYHEIDKLIITASGGSFRDRTREELRDVSVEEALNHPNWDMGGRITIDSATMMNKGFEVIEAHYLFDIPFDRIDVVIHKESVIHSMVQYRDHAIMAQLGTADMRLPIQYALSYPERLTMYDAQPFDFMKYPELHFQAPDFKRYPLLELAYRVGRKGGNLGAVMNAADEEAVALFLDKKISFLDIETSVLKAVEHITYIEHPNLDEILESDRQSRFYVHELWKGAVS